MSCTLATPPGTCATTASISGWLSVASGNISGVMATQPGRIPLAGTLTSCCVTNVCASVDSVGAVNSVCTPALNPTRRSCAINFTASSEWPPNSKKLSWRPTRSRPSSSRQIPASSVSSSPSGSA